MVETARVCPSWATYSGPVSVRQSPSSNTGHSPRGAPAGRRRRRRAWVITALVVGVVAVAGAIGVRAVSGHDDPVSRLVAEAGVGPARQTFPTTDTSGLSPVRARIVDVVHAEYDRNAPGTIYSDGVDESWCADFVSTVMRKAGVPFDNPNSGSWRIPGVATLTDYLHSSGRWRAASHVPEPGDIVIYDAPSHFRQHTNIVVATDGSTVTTVGGAEAQGITVDHFDPRTVEGVQGYGVP